RPVREPNEARVHAARAEKPGRLEEVPATLALEKLADREDTARRRRKAEPRRERVPIEGRGESGLDLAGVRVAVRDRNARQLARRERPREAAPRVLVRRDDAQTRGAREE